MGSYNYELKKYNKRNKETICPFIDINEEIIREIVNIIENKLDNEEIYNINNFKKLYANIENKKTEEYINKDGIWIKYNEGSLEDAIKLYNSLKDKNTHWCTTNKTKAINQVCGGLEYTGGDFYVYYTKDKNGDYTVPRMGIRMNHKEEIGEIRGVLDKQNLEEEMIPILEKKIK